MSEYDLVCDACGRPCDPNDAFVSWRSEDAREDGFALTHAGCVPDTATERREVRRLVWPNEFLRFATERFGRVVADPEPLRSIVWALAPFVMRHDSAAEMDGMRAASFGAIPGVKPGTQPVRPAAAAPKTDELEAGK